MLIHCSLIARSLPTHSTHCRIGRLHRLSSLGRAESWPGIWDESPPSPPPVSALLCDNPPSRVLVQTHRQCTCTTQALHKRHTSTDGARAAQSTAILSRSQMSGASHANRLYYCSLLLLFYGVQAQTCKPANYAANGALDGVTLDSTLAFQYKDTDLGVTLPSGLTQSTSMKFLLAGDACCTGAVGVHRPESAPDSACVYCSRPHNLIPCCRLARTRVEGFSQPQTFSKGCASYLPRERTRSALHSTTPRRFSTPTISC